MEVGEIVFLETSHKMQQLQRETVEHLASIPKSWYEHIEDVPKGRSLSADLRIVSDMLLDWDGCTFIIGNEFFDTLPINIFQRTEEGMKEILIALAGQDGAEKLQFVLAPSETPSQLLLPPDAQLPDEGDRIEICADADFYTGQISEILKKSHVGSAALIIDYGKKEGDRNPQGSLRAFHKHQIVHPLSHPGNIDITANVDFGKLLSNFKKDGALQAFATLNQSHFLQALGLKERLQSLIDRRQQKQNGEHNAQRLIEGAHRLIDVDTPTGLGSNFRVLAVRAKNEAMTDETAYPFTVPSKSG